MAAIGNSPTQQAFTPAIDYFSGNGSTTAFTLSRPVASVAQVQVVVNNVAQNPSSAYTISSNTITFTSAPSSGTNNIYVYYTSPITQVIAPSQGTVGTTALADASVTTAKLANLTTLPTSGGNVTIPAVAGTMMVSGNMPAFRAYLSSNQSISNSTNTKVQLNTKNFDTANCFDNTTNYRYTPNVAGYYQFSAVLALSGSNIGNGQALIYKNGSTVSNSVFYAPGLNGVSQINAVLSDLIYMNGSTDYIELYGYISASSSNLFGGNSAQAYLAGYLARAA